MAVGIEAALQLLPTALLLLLLAYDDGPTVCGVYGSVAYAELHMPPAGAYAVIEPPPYDGAVVPYCGW